ncbi:MAG TPA: bifunctional acetate--CoA ligase family protein/GNAT family N-acetyltransferase [Hansschlegelia sp.]
MTVRNLDAVFAPRSVALAGGSPRPESVGRAVLRNLREAGFEGPVGLVNPDHAELDGVPAARSFSALSFPADLAIVTAPPDVVPRLLDEAGAAGARAAVVVTRGLGSGPGSLREQAEQAARLRGLRLVGPGCFGVQSPYAKLNASIAPAGHPGDLALVSQSGGVMASTIEWANARGIGFSGVVSFGDMVDVDVDDLLDHFALDRRTRAILLYLRDVADAPRFLSAARAAARIKPVVVVKGGRRRQAARGVSQAGTLAMTDAVYDAAFRRAGLLRVADIAELFSAAETLAHVAPLAGKRIAIVANGGALGQLAADRLVDLGGRIAAFGDQTRAAIAASLPEIGVSDANPVDLRGDATAALYETALDAVLADAGVDAALAVHAPTSLSPAPSCARAVSAAAKRARARSYPPKPVFAAFLGSDPAPRATLEAAHIPFFRTPEAAVAGLMHLVRHVEAQEALVATPPSSPEAFSPDVPRARSAIEAGLASGRAWLSPTDVAEVLAAYAIPTLPQAFVATPEDAAEVAGGMIGRSGAALKIISPDIPDRASVGGLRLGLESAEAVAEAARAMLARVAERSPGAHVDGFVVQPHVRLDEAQELFAGIADDPVFGPVIVFGAGGGAAELLRDVALALPPLHLGLALEAMARTRIGALLDGYDGRAAVDRDAVALTLVKLAQLAADMPEIRELDINPLVATPRGAVAFDARIRVTPAARSARPGAANPRFAIRPYPKQYESRLTMPDGGEIAVRPARPEDEPAIAAFFRAVDPEDLRQRFFTPMKEVPRAFIARLTQVDYARTMTLLAIDAEGAVLGVAQLHSDPDAQGAEYAILLQSRLKGRGLGWRLMRALIRIAKAEGLASISGQVLAENRSMLAVCRELGFDVRTDPDDASIRLVSLDLVA